MKNLILLIILLFSGSVFSQNNVTWEEVAGDSKAPSKIAYQTGQGYLISLLSNPDRFIISKNKGKSWEDIEFDKGSASIYNLASSFRSDEYGNTFIFKDSSIYKLDITNSKFNLLFSKDDWIRDIALGHGNLYVLHYDKFDIYDNAKFKKIASSFLDKLPRKIVLGGNNKNHVLMYQGNIVNFDDNGKVFQVVVDTENVANSWYIGGLNSGRIVTMNNGDIYSSDDDGKTWQLIKKIDANESTEDFITNSDNEILVLLGNYILKSKDEGVTWEKLPFRRFLNQMNFFNNKASEIIIYSRTGCYETILQSSNKGKTWFDVFMPNTNISRIEGLILTKDNDFIIEGCDSRFEIIKEKNTSNFRKIALPDTSHFIQLIDIPSGKWFARDIEHDCFLSNNKGKSWKKFTMPSSLSANDPFNRLMRNQFNEFVYIDKDRYFTSKDGEIWKETKAPNLNFMLDWNGKEVFVSNGFLYSLYEHRILNIYNPIEKSTTILTNFNGLNISSATDIQMSSNQSIYLIFSTGNNLDRCLFSIKNNEPTFTVKKINLVSVGSQCGNFIIDKNDNFIVSGNGTIVQLSQDDGNSWVSMTANLPKNTHFDNMVIGLDQTIYFNNFFDKIYKTTAPISKPYKIQGAVFLDKNKNCQKDANEPYLKGIKLNLNASTGSSRITNDKGFFKFNVFDGDYKLVPAANTFTYETCAAEYPVTVNATKDSVNIDIPLKVVNLCASLNVTMTAPFLRRCFTNTYYGKICNDGSIDATNTKVEIVLDSLFDFESASLPIVSQVGKTLILDAGTVKQGDCKDFFIKFKVSCNAKIGQEHCIKATVSSPDECNDQGKKGYGYVECLKNVGAFDPNDKAAFVNGKKEATLVKTGQKLEYLIRFQNTGTDTAFNIVVKDAIHANLDASSIEPGVASHKYNWEVRDNVLYLNFNNIMLPDSNKSEMMSHGFVKFSIRPKANITTKDLITNTAGIYFDFNDAVITNEVILNKKTSKTQDFALSDIDFSLFPNPTNESVQIEVPVLEAVFSSVNIYSIEGKLMQKERFQGKNTILDVHMLPSGLYILEIKNGAKRGTKKLVIQN